MVSGHIFHCRKNSWPAEEYVGRTALQLVSPPTFGSCRPASLAANLFCFSFSYCWVV
jgi:hypothetical protein